MDVKQSENVPTQEGTIELSEEDLDQVGGGLLGVDGTHN
jgi:hypothetical protein